MRRVPSRLPNNSPVLRPGLAASLFWRDRPGGRQVAVKPADAVVMEARISSRDEEILSRAIQVALRARAAGNHPFGAILADGAGKILLEAENTVVSERDPTAHAETNLIRMASQQGLGELLRGSTLYASTEPCPMCSGAIYWGNVGRVVYGLSQERLYAILVDAGSQDALIVHCAELLGHGERAVEVLGPALEDKAAEVHETFWHKFLSAENSPSAD